MLTLRVAVQALLFAPFLIAIELACTVAECFGYVVNRD